jgi:DNA-binding GntR family transcriptional regulator
VRVPTKRVAHEPIADRSTSTASRQALAPPHPSAALKRRSSAEQAAAYIRELIFAGDLAPGDRIPQDEIARTLGISRIPIREAIVALEREGRIRTELHRGSFVVELDEQSIRDAVEITGLIQSFVRRLAAERATSEVKRQLTELQQQIDTTTDPIEMRRHLGEFRALILAAGTAPRIAQWIRGMDDLVSDNHFQVIPGAVESFKGMSSALSRAILEGDAEAAGSIPNQYSHADVEELIRFYTDHGLFSNPDK